METYRHALYRYSTGQGFNVNVDVPSEPIDVASFKMKPLKAKLIRPEFNVNLKREADRISMQMEAAAQQLKVLGYHSEAGKRYRDLKARVEVIKHLMANYPIEYIKKEDLEKIYELYEKNVPGLDKLIKKVVKQNKGATGVHEFVGSTMRVRKGYPLYDQFGRKLSKKEKKTFKEGLKLTNGMNFSGFGEGSKKTKLAKLIGWGLIIVALYKLAT